MGFYAVQHIKTFSYYVLFKYICMNKNFKTMELTSINSLIEEIDYLNKKAQLLDEILKYYDRESMTFGVPDKWKNTNRIGIDKLRQIPKSPRHALNKLISQLIPYSEHENKVNWEQINETAAD